MRLRLRKRLRRDSLESIAVLFFSFTLLLGQEKTIRVWDRGIPGAIIDTSYKEKTIYINGNNPRLMNVTDPTLDVYPVRGDHATGAAVIICPGGAYARLAIDHEGSEVAAWLNELGISAFVLKYRLPNDAIMVDKSIGPLQDAQEAMRIVRRRAKEWNLDPHKIGIMGFSAGGHLAATLSTHFREKVYESIDTTSARPDFSILVYPVISMDSVITHRGSRENLLGKTPSAELVRRFSNERCVTADTPPAILIHALDDSTVPIQNSIDYTMALKEHGVPAEMHLYERGGHGFGLGIGMGPASAWPEACKRWFHSRGIL